MRRTTDEVLMRRYILGDLPQEERDRLEDRYSADAEVFEEMLATENDLIDSYVRGELAQVERRQFEAEFLKSPLRRERVQFARALSQVSAPATEPDLARDLSPWKEAWRAISAQQGMPRWALVAAAVVIMAAGSWLMVQNRRLQRDLRQSRSGPTDLRREEDTLRQRAAHLEGNANSQVQENGRGSEIAGLEPPIGPEVSFRLTPGLSRGPDRAQKAFALPPTASRLRLQLLLDRGGYPTYEAILLTPEGKEVLRGQGLHSDSIDRSVMVDWSFPAQSIHSGDYIVKLIRQTANGSKKEDVDSYSFRVLRR